MRDRQDRVAYRARRRKAVTFSSRLTCCVGRRVGRRVGVDSRYVPRRVPNRARARVDVFCPKYCLKTGCTYIYLHK